MRGTVTGALAAAFLSGVSLPAMATTTYYVGDPQVTVVGSLGRDLPYCDHSICLSGSVTAFAFPANGALDLGSVTIGSEFFGGDFLIGVVYGNYNIGFSSDINDLDAQLIALTPQPDGGPMCNILDDPNCPYDLGLPPPTEETIGLVYGGIVSLGLIYDITSWNPDTRPSPLTTPLPATLPLLGTVLGGLGLLGWRRKRAG